MAVALLTSAQCMSELESTAPEVAVNHSALVGDVVFRGDATTLSSWSVSCVNKDPDDECGSSSINASGDMLRLQPQSDCTQGGGTPASDGVELNAQVSLPLTGWYVLTTTVHNSPELYDNCPGGFTSGSAEIYLGEARLMHASCNQPNVCEPCLMPTVPVRRCFQASGNVQLRLRAEIADCGLANAQFEDLKITQDADINQDGIGDACQDTDQDGINNSFDNCPNAPNSNQLDEDSDGIGDACDTDNDNDGVPDTSDNCPLAFNPNQADVDHDGAGNVCDSDDDGDGVLDAVDSCRSSAAGEPVNPDGCTIADLCPCATNWRNQFAYLGCVTNTVNEFVSEGWISRTLGIRIWTILQQYWQCGAN